MIRLYILALTGDYTGGIQSLSTHPHADEESDVLKTFMDLKSKKFFVFCFKTKT